MNWVLLVILNRIYQTPWLLTAYKALKYIIHATTNTSEIYRLCNSTIVNSQLDTPSEKEQDIVIEYVSKDIIYRIDQSILYSTQLKKERLQLQEGQGNIDDMCQSIMLKKQFPSSMTSPAAQVLNISLKRISEANQVLHKIEQQVTTKYDSNQPEHEEKLLKLWSEMMPDTELESRMSKQWVEIGFQGNDPATDFRGMGIQGLNDLLYFVHHYPNQSLTALQHASHPIYWYPYAIVGINITKFAYQCLESKKLQLYLFQYNTTTKSVSEFYCYLFHHFDLFWSNHQPPLTVMDFESKFLEFQYGIEKDLILEKVMPLSFLLLK